MCPLQIYFSCLTHKKDLFNCLTYKEVGCFAKYRYADKNWKFLAAFIITEAANILVETKRIYIVPLWMGTIHLLLIVKTDD